MSRPFDQTLSFRGDVTALVAALAPWGPYVLLDDSTGAQRCGYLAVLPDASLQWSRGSGRLKVEGRADQAFAGDPLPAARELLGPQREAPPGAPRFVGGLCGHWGYDLRCAFDDLPDERPADSTLPDLRLWRFPLIIAHDSEALPHALRLFALEDTAPVRERASRIEAALGEVGACSHRGATRVGTRPAVSNLPRADYLTKVGQIREAIRDGEVYQVNLTQRFLLRCEDEPLSVFERLRQLHPAAYAALLVGEGASVLSFSPELFFDVEDAWVTTRPIKGTAARAEDPALDRRRRTALLASEKDRAELAMIVDLMRNDLSRVCEAATVRCREHAVLETMPTVHHLVSTIEGRLAPGQDVFDLLRAAFPGGSITGAPRRRAMEFIESLETLRRGVYTGSIGFLGFDGRACLNIAIRTLVLEDGYARIHGGGGIVIDSDPEAEWAESVVKVKGLLDGLGGVIA
ncbi:MAG: aminodeoxychorismate synthase component I [Planctomycetes bacterium]|nr:aminodeoxychorismate synthase component I [Planctomycetota bacterium]